SIIFLARLEGDSWVSVGEGVDYYVNKLGAYGNNLYIVGDFGTAGGLAANGFAIWNGSNWSGIDEQLQSGYRVSAAALGSGGILLAEFQETDPFPLTASRISRWDGRSYSPVVETGGRVFAMSEFKDKLVCAGDFQFNGGVRTGNVA